jgi:hypothetical protein
MAIRGHSGKPPTGKNFLLHFERPMVLRCRSGRAFFRRGRSSFLIAAGRSLTEALTRAYGARPGSAAASSNLKLPMSFGRR